MLISRSMFIFWGSTWIYSHDFQLKTLNLSHTGPLSSPSVQPLFETGCFTSCLFKAPLCSDWLASRSCPSADFLNSIWNMWVDNMNPWNKLSNKGYQQTAVARTIWCHHKEEVEITKQLEQVKALAYARIILHTFTSCFGPLTMFNIDIHHHNSMKIIDGICQLMGEAKFLQHTLNLTLLTLSYKLSLLHKREFKSY